MITSVIDTSPWSIKAYQDGYDAVAPGSIRRLLNSHRFLPATTSSVPVIHLLMCSLTCIYVCAETVMCRGASLTVCESRLRRGKRLRNGWELIIVLEGS